MGYYTSILCRHAKYDPAAACNVYLGVVHRNRTGENLQGALSKGYTRRFVEGSDNGDFAFSVYFYFILAVINCFAGNQRYRTGSLSGKVSGNVLRLPRKNRPPPPA